MTKSKPEAQQTKNGVTNEQMNKLCSKASTNYKKHVKMVENLKK